METKTLAQCVESLIRKAEQAHSAVEALQLTQAAANAANAMCALNNAGHPNQ